jgi:hypothetical protein
MAVDPSSADANLLRTIGYVGAIRIASSGRLKKRVKPFLISGRENVNVDS